MIPDAPVSSKRSLVKNVKLKSQNGKKPLLLLLCQKIYLGASKLSALGVSTKYVKKCLKKIKRGKTINPILLVRDCNKLIVADGYHRLCAVYSIDEEEMIPCKIV